MVDRMGQSRCNVPGDVAPDEKENLMMNGDPKLDLGRFLAAQTESYAQVLQELRSGQKRSHWMWYIFPQLEGLGNSATARHFALRSADEARAYLAHPLLGRRLVDVTEAVLAHADRSLLEIFGHPDDLKFRSSMTLFAAVALNDEGAVFRRALDVFCDGVPDAATLRLLGD